VPGDDVAGNLMGPIILKIFSLYILEKNCRLEKISENFSAGGVRLWGASGTLFNLWV
jgi:hypothetical protein